MIVLVCGSRDWTDRDRMADALAEFAAEPAEVVMIHGDARGADRMAGEIAWLYGYTVRAFPADWDKLGKSAGFQRNIQMLDERPDLVVAFQVGESRGTAHTIDQARRRGIPVEVHHATKEDPMARPTPQHKPRNPPTSPKPPPGQNTPGSVPIMPDPPTAPEPPPEPPS